MGEFLRYIIILIQNKMFQHMIATFPCSQFGLPFNYVEVGDYHQTIQAQIQNLEQKLEELRDENQGLKKKLNRMKERNQNQTLCKKKKKRRRRSLDSIEKDFKCDFPECNKEYASDLALNLHIKNKHNGGTKTERQQLAKEIVLAEQKGVCLPNISINFPPGYLTKFRKQFFNES